MVGNITKRTNVNRRNNGTDKAGQKHIQERVRKLSFRIVEEANEYARLYEKSYYKEVMKMCQQRIDVIDTYHKQITRVANNET